MASTNDGDRATAGILRLLVGMAAAEAPPAALARVGGGGTLLVHLAFVDGDGDMFSGGIGGGVPPASKAAIAALKEVKAQDGQVEEEEGGSLGECAICLDGVEGTAKETPCGHRFHGDCLERWLGVHGNCPVCRRELPPAKEDVDEEAEGAGEARRPRGVVVTTYVLLGREPEPEQQQQQEEREEPWNIRIEDVD